MAETVALIDFGAGNLHSVHNALKAAGADHVAVTDDPAVVRSASRIVLPGVGAFAACKGALDSIDGMVEAMHVRVHQDAVPFLGICVGMQMLADRSVEFGETQGLGWIAGSVEEIPATSETKVPHMGWNQVQVGEGTPLIEPGEAYFLHSFHFAAQNDSDIAATTQHGRPLVAAVARDNVLGVQFHPEKSQSYGLSLLSRFLEWKP